MDVISLQEALDHALQQRQARETGICPIREELYAQCLDELIRQVTVNCIERGLLLKRVRDELRDTVAAYQSLYESSVAYGMRKALIAEQRRGALSQLLGKLNSHKSALEAEADRLEHRLANLEADEKAKEEAAKAAHEEEVGRLREHNAALKAQLEELLAPPSK
jgi:dynein light intermediate chain, axonemal